MLRQDYYREPINISGRGRGMPAPRAIDLRAFAQRTLQAG